MTAPYLCLNLKMLIRYIGEEASSMSSTACTRRGGRTVNGKCVTRFACPETKSFPIDSEGHVRAALGYWRHKNVKSSNKCKGGRKRICSAAKYYGIDASSCPV